RAPLAIAPDMAEGEQPLFPRRQQLLAGKLRRRMEVEGPARSVWLHRLGRKGRQMGLVARRNLQGRRLDLDEAAFGKPSAQGGANGVARQQARSPVGMNMRAPPG